MTVLPCCIMFLSCKQPEAAPTDNFCTVLLQLTAAADDEFESVRGSLVRHDSISEYNSKVILSESFNNNIQYQKDVVPAFFASLYQGRDSTQAFRRYIDFSDQLMLCLPDWKVGDKKKFENLGNRTYVIFVHGDVVLYAVFEKEAKTSFTWVMITQDPDNTQYSKIHNN